MIEINIFGIFGFDLTDQLNRRNYEKLLKIHLYFFIISISWDKLDIRCIGSLNYKRNSFSFGY